ncbi:Crp/Fnr family transcriptional regulator [Vibrio sp. SCSIO 43136]|uniref:Crp/Fnr family transcriptional regulator n=1 Tax=Vibrio sp. SCSIO 43136 TaxID=2819101 RepID=UPI0020764AEC|nr:Crp/Fnr family transcriptional regulator [Vibrio sp. SCSIO 43136]USD68021.1 Crp/Fnr family transcriptional regulator [Vibrio sp. SCSIO 43136]
MNNKQTLIKIYELSESLAQTLVTLGKFETVPKSQYINLQDQCSTDLWLLLSGRLALFSACEERANQSYNIIGPGVPVNEVPLLLGTSAVADIQTSEESLALRVPFTACTELLKNDIEFLRFISLSVAKKQRVLHALFQLRAMKSEKRKVLSALQILTDLNIEGYALTNINNLSSLLYMSRNRVSKILLTLTDAQDIVQVHGGYQLTSKHINE